MLYAEFKCNSYAVILNTATAYVLKTSMMLWNILYVYYDPNLEKVLSFNREEEFLFDCLAE